MTHQYELMVILDPEIDERTVAPSLDKFLNVIRTDGGSIDSVDIWGRRRLAYEINKKTDGYYVFFNVLAEGAALDEVERTMRLADDVVRHKLIRLPDREAARRGMSATSAA